MNKSIDRCRARGCGGLLFGLEAEILDGTTVYCSRCRREHLFHVADGVIRVEIERKPR